jgi:hypothetical protein
VGGVGGGVGGVPLLPCHKNGLLKASVEGLREPCCGGLRTPVQISCDLEWTLERFWAAI